MARFACRTLRSGNNLTDEDFDVLLKLAGPPGHQDALVSYTGRIISNNSRIKMIQPKTFWIFDQP